MRFATSFFNPTLYKKQLTRYWPLWALWLAGWFLAVDVSIWNYWRWGHSAEYVSDLLESLPLMMTYISLAMAAVTAVAVYFYLFKSRAQNFMGSLPVTRECLFLTSMVSGLTILLVPILLVALSTFGILAVTGFLTAETAALTASWLLSSVIVCFFWFEFASLCCTISGNAIAAIAFYAIFNGIFVVMTLLVSTLLSETLYGFAGDLGWWEKAVQWLTPVWELTELTGYNFTGTGGMDWELMSVFFGLGLAFFLGAIALHHIRKSERAGDLVAFVPLRYAFKVCVTLCGGLAFGMFLTLAFTNNSVNSWAIVFWCALSAVICYFAAEMLLQKTFRVFGKNSWLTAAASALVFVLALTGVKLDFFGFVNRVPDLSSVTSVTVDYNGLVDEIAEYGLTYSTPEATQTVLDLHQYAISPKGRETAETLPNVETKFIRVVLEYNLHGIPMKRDYSLWINENDADLAIFNAAIRSGSAEYDLSQTPSSIVYVDQTEGLYYSYQLSSAEQSRIFEAIKADVEAGNYQATQGAERNYAEFPYLEIMYPRYDARGELRGYNYRNFCLRATTVNVAQCCEELELFQKAKKEYLDENEVEYSDYYEPAVVDEDDVAYSDYYDPNEYELSEIDGIIGGADGPTTIVTTTVSTAK